MTAKEFGELWIERLSAISGADSIARKLGWEKSGPYVFVIIIDFINVPILSTIAYMRGGAHPLLEYPTWVALPLLLLLFIYVTRIVRKRCRVARRSAGRRESADPLPIDSMRDLRLIFYVVLFTGYVFVLLLAGTDLLIAEGGLIISGIKYLLIVPLLYFVVLTDFGSAIIFTQIGIPVSIAEQDVELDFDDPKRLGGMDPVGTLMSAGVAGYYLGLSILTGAVGVQTLLGLVGPATESVEPITILAFVIAWVIGFIPGLIGIRTLHRHMRSKKETKIEELMDRIETLGVDNETFVYSEKETEIDHLKYLKENTKLQKVRETRTFPFNTYNLWESVTSALLPIGLQIITML